MLAQPLTCRPAVNHARQSGSPRAWLTLAAWQAAPADLLTVVRLQRDNSWFTEETCTQYNILKVARSLFQWTGNSGYADWYERVILNGMLGAPLQPVLPCADAVQCLNLWLLLCALAKALTVWSCLPAAGTLKAAACVILALTCCKPYFDIKISAGTQRMPANYSAQPYHGTRKAPAPRVGASSMAHTASDELALPQVNPCPALAAACTWCQCLLLSACASW